MGWEGYGAQLIVASSISDPRSLTTAHVERVRKMQNTDIDVRCKRNLHVEQEFIFAKNRTEASGSALLLAQRADWVYPACAAGRDETGK